MRHTDMNKGVDKSKLFLFPIANEVENDDVRDMFERYGEIVDVSLPVDKFTRRRKGFGFVSFTTELSGMNAQREAHGKILGGKIVKVTFKNESKFPGYARGYSPEKESRRDRSRERKRDSEKRKEENPPHKRSSSHKEGREKEENRELSPEPNHNTFDLTQQFSTDENTLNPSNSSVTNEGAENSSRNERRSSDNGKLLRVSPNEPRTNDFSKDSNENDLEKEESTKEGRDRKRKDTKERGRGSKSSSPSGRRSSHKKSKKSKEDREKRRKDESERSRDREGSNSSVNKNGPLENRNLQETLPMLEIDNSLSHINNAHSTNVPNLTPRPAPFSEILPSPQYPPNNSNTNNNNNNNMNSNMNNFNTNNNANNNLNPSSRTFTSFPPINNNNNNNNINNNVNPSQSSLKEAWPFLPQMPRFLPILLPIELLEEATKKELTKIREAENNGNNRQSPTLNQALGNIPLSVFFALFPALGNIPTIHQKEINNNNNNNNNNNSNNSNHRTGNLLLPNNNNNNHHYNLSSPIYTPTVSQELIVPAPSQLNQQVPSIIEGPQNQNNFYGSNREEGNEIQQLSTRFSPRENNTRNSSYSNENRGYNRDNNRNYRERNNYGRDHNDRGYYDDQNRRRY